MSLSRSFLAIFTLIILSIVVTSSGCIGDDDESELERDGRWGIYSLDISSSETKLIVSFDEEVKTIRLDPYGAMLVFSKPLLLNEDSSEEIFTVTVEGYDLVRVTSNEFWDLYPTWSSNGSEIFHLSWRADDLDIYVIRPGDEESSLIYDSGSHDADIHCNTDRIVFTSKSCICIMREDGSGMRTVTDPPMAGDWGEANLPFGDYDPQLDPSGSWIVFERLEDDESPHGNYNIYKIRTDGTDETKLTYTGHSQGFASWSHDGEKLVYLVAAIDGQGAYDIYLMDKNGNDIRNITPDYYPEGFLCHAPIFSIDDSKIYFIGQWWEN